MQIPHHLELDSTEPHPNSWGGITITRTPSPQKFIEA